MREGKDVARSLILERPLVFGDKGVDHLFHGEIRNQLILCEFDTRHRIEVADALQMLLDVFALIRDARWSNYRFAEDIKADLAA